MKQKVDPSPLKQVIAALGLDETEAAIVEDIMRNEVFHSTLDWQTYEELLGGAIRAHELFRRDEGFHRAALRYRQASYRLSVAEEHPGGVIVSPSLAAARKEEAEARKMLEQFLSHPLADRYA